jgi:hypothetical protein
MSELDVFIDEVSTQLVDDDDDVVNGLIEVDFVGDEPDNGLMVVVRCGDDALVVRLGYGDAGLTAQVDTFADGERARTGMVMLEPTALIFIER